eukprot:CAMPEP_0168567338 /NCGR_PEP_ID=MMETSP0413-20121227/14952_1 /TAXON_ID=136452 /ORGANISM="Filamoeba nolandi, Strain NC-AS-23-1" /LENGTH=64 /DNA_ID=CAMNT_0008599523 /DNA_START=19 /DNA_END=213 /DNA_ORIENTATION=+
MSLDISTTAFGFYFVEVKNIPDEASLDIEVVQTGFTSDNESILFAKSRCPKEESPIHDDDGMRG